jgi:hypothetical protein
MPRTLEDWAIEDDWKREDMITREIDHELYPPAHAYCHQKRSMCTRCRTLEELTYTRCWPWSRGRLRWVLDMLFDRIYDDFRCGDGSFNAESFLDRFFRLFYAFATHTRDLALEEDLSILALRVLRRVLTGEIEMVMDDDQCIIETCYYGDLGVRDYVEQEITEAVEALVQAYGIFPDEDEVH